MYSRATGRATAQQTQRKLKMASSEWEDNDLMLISFTMHNPVQKILHTKGNKVCHKTDQAFLAGQIRVSWRRGAHMAMVVTAYVPHQ